jgi:hypothetical protein
MQCAPTKFSNFQRNRIRRLRDYGLKQLEEKMADCCRPFCDVVVVVRCYGPVTVGNPVLVALPATTAGGAGCSQRMKNCKFVVLPVYVL